MDGTLHVNRAPQWQAELVQMSRFVGAPAEPDLVARVEAGDPAAVAEEIALRLQWQMAVEREEDDAMALELILRHLA